MTHYDAGNIDRLYSEQEKLFSDEAAVYPEAVARLLGRDAGRLANADTMNVVLAILEKELAIDGDLHLLGDMLSGSTERAEHMLFLIENFRQGLLDTLRENTNPQASEKTAEN